MTIDTRTSNGVTILEFHGKLTIEVTAQVRKAIQDLLEAGRKNILLDLGDVSFMDSSGIGEMVRSYHSVRREGGQVKLLNLTKKIQELLAITKLVTIFQSFDDEAEAVSSYSA
jgi:anti-sigma B factor antagonist